MLGGLAERFKAAVLKTVEGNTSVGSNPMSSATFQYCAKYAKQQKVQYFYLVLNISILIMFFAVSSFLLTKQYPERENASYDFPIG